MQDRRGIVPMSSDLSMNTMTGLTHAGDVNSLIDTGQRSDVSTMIGFGFVPAPHPTRR